MLVESGKPSTILGGLRLGFFGAAGSFVAFHGCVRFWGMGKVERRAKRFAWPARLDAQGRRTNPIRAYKLRQERREFCDRFL
jgi:hypothetical protein